MIYCKQRTTISEDNNKVSLKKDSTLTVTDSVHLGNIKPITLSKLEIPKTSPNDIIITHTGYFLVYNEAHEQAKWIAYELTSAETKKNVNRTNKFKPDPYVKTYTANDKDYANSGYDRGHLAPASDMGWSSITMAESFYYSNMSPQEPSFNRGIWKRLEELVRTWAIENNSIYIVTGPVLTSGLPTIGTNNVSVPKYFYKVILDYTEPDIKGIGFILQNEGSSNPLYNYAVTIDSVEKFTGIDFFPTLPDQQEKAIEGNLCIKCWTWKNAKIASNKSYSSAQCKGNTKVGNRCKNHTLNASGYCYLHENQQKNNSTATNSYKKNRRTISVQCSGITKAGNRCKRKTLSPNGLCYQHGGN